MLKLSRTGIGLLTAQYRSILKKCFILNMVAAGAMLYAGSAKAENYDFDINKVTNTSETSMQSNLSKMGTEIGHLEDEPDRYLGILVYNGSDTLTKTIVSKDGLPSGTYGEGTQAWVVNNGLLGVGYEYDTVSGKLVAKDEGTLISNKHNAGARDTSLAGGVFLNHSEQGSDQASALMLVHNAEFTNNSASYFGSFLDETAGGAIENIANYRNHLSGLDNLLSASGIDSVNNNIEASTFDNNFVMNFYRARGGAVYNNSEYAITTTGSELIRGIINSSANIYRNNHAGNTEDFTADETVRKYILGTEGNIPQSQITTWKNSNLYASGERVDGMTDFAQGGAIFNNDTYTSDGDGYFGNFAQGKYAEGGAVYNGAPYTDLGITVTPTFTVENGAVYANNFVVSYEAQDHVVEEDDGPYVGGHALGGAVYNAGDYIMLNDGGEREFSTNHAAATDTAMGGAAYNSGNMEIYGSAFSGNYAGMTDSATNTSIAAGGAVASQMSDGNLALNIHDSTFSENHVDSFNLGYGGALYNNNASALTTVTDTNFTENYINVNESKGGNITAFGGAIYNNNDSIGSVSRLAIKAESADVDISNNSIKVSTATTDATRYYYGGAVYNGINGQLAISSSAGRKVSVNNNNKDGNGNVGVVSRGGAIYNAANGIYSPTAVDTAYFLIDGNGGNIEIKGTIATDAGGALYNEGKAEIVASNGSEISIENNQAATGGAIYNSVGSTVVTDMSNGTVNYNENIATENGGALYNEGTFNVEGSGNGSLQFTENTAKEGGAIYNNVNSVVDISLEGNAGATFSANEAINGSGGAVYNKSNNFGLGFENGVVAFSENTATENGGAVYNEGTFNVDGSGNGALQFTENTAKEGGAIYNNVNSVVDISLEGSAGATFSANKATNGSGGAVHNSESVFGLGFKNGVADFSDNTASEFGGVVYNNGAEFVIGNDNGSGSLEFSNNSAGKGGAIYNGNDGNVEADISGDATILFDGNVSSEGEGGAIYNDEDSSVDVTLSDTAKLVFNTTSDDVYNLGTVTITGDSAAPQTLEIDGMEMSTIDPAATQVVLNSTFAGTGQYNISNTQLNLGSTGYIDEEPEMVMTNNVVNMAEGSHIYLTSDDTLTNNNFDLASDSVLRYTDTVTDDTDFYLANTVYNAGRVEYYASADDTDIRIAQAAVNSGVISAADGVLTNVHIDTLQSLEGNEIVINLDNDNLQADVVTIDHRIYNTTETPTKITFVDMENEDINEVQLEVDERIYFAQTQVEQNLSEYGFSVNAENSDYEIKIGYEENDDVYDWYLYRYDEPVPPEPDYLEPEDLAYIDLPRSAVEQTRGIVFDITRTTNRGMCRCYADNCNNRFCRQEASPAKYRLWARPTYRKGTFDKPLETDFTLKGIEFGLDYQPTNSALIGVFGSYRDGKYENDGGKVGKKFYAPKGGSELEIKSYLAGLYFRKYFGDFYFLGAGYLGKQDVDMKTKKTGVKGSTDGVNVGAQAELGYDIRTSNRSVLTPSLRATYDYIKFDDLTDNKGKKAEFSTINDFELEAALKFEYQFNNENQLPTTGYIKPSVIQTIESGGKVTINDEEYDDALKNETLGRIEIGADAELIENFSVGAFGNYTFGSNYKAWGVGGNVRYVW
ncbi:MAG: autotransporter domain-containing protein [Alphaproteobacteria bacterium]|nr:autotransporter domain-containing protein [Alphaproteobacteria bacterium]